MSQYFIEQSRLAHFLYASPRSALLWFVVRLYLGYEWVSAGWEKLHDAAWVGDSSGAALSGFIQGALKKTAAACQPAPAACHPDVQDWYAAFLQNAVLPHVALWSNLVAFGELLVGIALILGIFVGIAAFFGAFMNLNFMLAGTVSVSPIMFTLAIFLVLAWRIAGYWGGDRIALPIFFRSVHGQSFRR